MKSVALQTNDNCHLLKLANYRKWRIIYISLAMRENLDLKISGLLDILCAILCLFAVSGCGEIGKAIRAQIKAGIY